MIHQFIERFVRSNTENLSAEGRLRLGLLNQLMAANRECWNHCQEADPALTPDRTVEYLCVEGLRAACADGKKTVLCLASGHLWAHFGDLPALLRHRGHNCLVVSTTPGESSPFNELIFYADPALLKLCTFVDVAICCFLTNPFFCNPPPFPVVGLSHQTTNSIDLDPVYWLMNADYHMCNLSSEQKRRLVPIYRDKFKASLIPRETIGPRRTLTLMPAGCPKIDRIALVRSHTGRSHINKILLCPSAADLKGYWIDTLGRQAVSALLENFPSFTIVYRPSPADRTRPETQALVRTFKDHGRFQYDQSADYAELYAQSALLITDTSDTGLTFSLATLKPTLYFTPTNVEEAPDAWLLGKRMGPVIVGTVDDLVKTVRSVLQSSGSLEHEIKAYMDEFVCHPGYAVERFLDYMDDILAGRVHADWISFSLPEVNVKGNTAQDFHLCMNSVLGESSRKYLVRRYVRHGFQEKMPGPLLRRIMKDVQDGNYHQGSLIGYFELACQQLRCNPDSSEVRQIVVDLFSKIGASNLAYLKANAVATLLGLIQRPAASKRVSLAEGMARFVERRIERYCLDSGTTRIGLFGAGRHTQWLHQSVRVPWGVTLLAIADDQFEGRRPLGCLSVRKPDRIGTNEFDVMVLSTDCQQAVFERRCREIWGPNVPLLDVYDTLPPGPFPKGPSEQYSGDEAALLSALAGRYAVMSLEVYRIRDGMKRVALFGAGKHSRSLWHFVPHWKVVGIELLKLLDDRPEGKQDPWGVGIVQPEDFDVRQVDAIVLSTDCNEQGFMQRCRSVWGDAIPLVSLYEGFIPGPYY